MQNRTTGTFTKSEPVYSNLPYKGFAAIELLAVEKALRSVWIEVAKRKNRHKIDFLTAKEDEISTALVLIFDDLIAERSGLLTELEKTFESLPEFNSHHGAVDYLGKPLTKRPDLTFRRRYPEPGTSKLNGSLFIEAKIIDQSRTMGKYCGDGLKRFVVGDYAWAMPQAMMLGYTRMTDQKLPDSLADHFKRLGKQQEFQLTEGPNPFPLSRFANRSYVTVHNRTWKYPGTDLTPGSISVLHLWLPV